MMRTAAMLPAWDASFESSDSGSYIASLMRSLLSSPAPRAFASARASVVLPEPSWPLTTTRRGSAILRP